MTRPLTCLTLIAAAGAGLYLYQEKHRAQLIDREINRVVHVTEQLRERSSMMRAEWALLNEPDRLAGLAAQHLALQTMVPGQFVQLADLASHLPAVGAPSLPPPAMEPAAPVAAAPPAQPKIDVAKTEPVKPPMPAQSGPGLVLATRPPTPLMVQATPQPPPARPVRMAAAKPREPEPAYRSTYTPVYAPVMQAFAGQTPAAIRPPTIQQAAAGLPASAYGEPAPYVGSALGMARTALAAPVPMGAAQGQ